ncbi:glycogen synthase [Halomonas salinarum]|uniref:glycogen synthase n=1 Tax=Halomonas salinarum TaxID=1158993 RepID=UPI00143A7A12|nr:glycogen/starch synthase [Halomonas salinarum]
MNILMVAAENDALEKGKVGGIGDVVRDIPPALAGIGHQVQVVVPGYQLFSRQPGARHLGAVKVRFGGREEMVSLFQVTGRTPVEGVTQWVLEHPLFGAGGAGRIYCDDPADRPFATDASKFALFSLAVAQSIRDGAFGQLDVVHLHDWHAALVAFLRRFHPEYGALGDIRFAFSIHNIALQGIRPLDGDASSLVAWYPDLSYDADAVRDPRYPECINAMRVGINLCDRVHAVSPTYVTEIVRPSDPGRGFFGGEGLEQDLQRAGAEHRLFGILNGADYSGEPPEPLSESELLQRCQQQVLEWIGANPLTESAHLIAHFRLSEWADQASPGVLMTSVGRITDQKVQLLRQPLESGQSALEELLDRLEGRGRLILLGSGDAEQERFLTRVAAHKRNFLFLRGYAESLSQHLYAAGDLFLMPSSFEPCGISQMLAMRAGQPCLVHRVGGLVDTVQDNVDGFSFGGGSLQEQAANLVARLDEVLAMAAERPEEWQAVVTRAAEARFLWSDAAHAYERQLYGREKSDEA